MSYQTQGTNQQFFFSPLEINPLDIMYVSQALLSGSRYFLLKAIIRERLGIEEPDIFLDSKCGDAIYRKLSSTLDVMQTISQEEVFCESELIVPWEEFRAESTCLTFRRYISAVLVREELLQDEQNELWVYKACSESIQAICDKSWLEVLNYKIWLPSTLCDRERYAVIASVFCAMVRCDFVDQEPLIEDCKGSSIASMLNQICWTNHKEAIKKLLAMREQLE